MQRSAPSFDHKSAHKVEFLFQSTLLTRQVVFRANVPLMGCTESIAAATLLPSMRHGRSLSAVDGEISRRLFDSISVIQDIHRSWDASLHRVELPRAIPVVRPSSRECRVGLYFSGGVDSCYSFLKHKDEITDLIFVRGFDLRPDNQPLCDQVSARLREVAYAYGKKFIEIETNIRDVLDPFVDWCSTSHGAAMASVGHLLYPALGKIYMSAPHTYADLFPCGSHPILDPLWSTEGLEFVHDGCEATRIEKVALLMTSEVCLRNLRVCFKNSNGAYNCGKCEKCLRTMINLHVNQALDRCTAFDQPLSLRRIARIDAIDSEVKAFVQENLRALEAKAIDPHLQAALRRVLRKPRWWLMYKAKVRRTIIAMAAKAPLFPRAAGMRRF